MKKKKICRCLSTKRTLIRGHRMMHYYRVIPGADDEVFDMFMQTIPMRECITKWRWCPIKKHLIGDCIHGKRGVLDETFDEGGGC